MRALGHSLWKRISPRGRLWSCVFQQRRAAIENIVDADLVAALVREIMADRAQWTGAHPTFGRSAETGLAGKESPRTRRPTAPGEDLPPHTRDWEGRLGMQTIRITATGENRSHNTVSTFSRVSDNDHEAALNHPPAGLEQAL
jgi:hypothetical protein